MVERALIEYCSATLASLKAGSLFNEAFQTEEELSLQLAMWNRCLTGKAVCAEEEPESCADLCLPKERPPQDSGSSGNRRISGGVRLPGFRGGRGAAAASEAYDRV